ncbi:helicase [Oryctes borbonicus]|uniref:Helicase n=1 Tax=Oryctes borbonicus TaxID=1629725 RepID=A0A0T6BAU2_9SCAR|nr:helicase [Oryctes borbonicus]
MNTQLLRDFDENVYTEGFDVQAGQTWIYPINYPLRNYQYNIVSEALYKNTLVSLPTGLGKTFIAAVLMYNFYRWFPSGKVVFMAPTKPLVKQQLEACYNIMAIPKDVTAELTGTKAQISRKDIWMNKRVFFITPQVLQNDLSLIPELGKEIKCIVIDEAHKAKGKHAYCEVLRQIVESNKHFRVLALSATPGSTINDVTEIINNLLISHLEIRTDDSPDVMPYVFQRTMKTIVVPLGEKLESVKAAYLQLLEKYTRILVTNRIIGGNNCANLTKGRIFMIMKEFQDKNRHTK